MKRPIITYVELKREILFFDGKLLRSGIICIKYHYIIIQAVSSSSSIGRHCYRILFYFFHLFRVHKREKSTMSIINFMFI